MVQNTYTSGTRARSTMQVCTKPNLQATWTKQGVCKQHLQRSIGGHQFNNFVCWGRRMAPRSLQQLVQKKKQLVQKTRHGYRAPPMTVTTSRG
jgi:hypothetical protein